MKKFLAIAIIATAFLACNNSSESSKTEDSTTVVTPDTSTIVMPAPDTTSKMDTSAKK